MSMDATKSFKEEFDILVAKHFPDRAHYVCALVVTRQSGYVRGQCLADGKATAWAIGYAYGNEIRLIKGDAQRTVDASPSGDLPDFRAGFNAGLIAVPEDAASMLKYKAVAP